MRTLVIAGDYPWPQDTGSRLRLSMLLRGLVRCGPTELLSVVSKYRTDVEPPEDAMGLAKVRRLGFDNRPGRGLLQIANVLHPSIPLALSVGDQSMVRAELARFMTGSYDLIWYFGAQPWVLAPVDTATPIVLDLADLEDEKIAARLSVPRREVLSATGRFRSVIGHALSREEIRRWRRLYRKASVGDTTVVVCSDLDALRADDTGIATVEVIPNGYPEIPQPLGRLAVGRPPSVLFQGLLRYPPNIDAATTLANELGPLLRTSRTDLEIRLVGEHQAGLMSLHDPPRVTVVGRVPDMAQELGRADLVVVPLRYGSGTRLKILEAFAHRIPVVSTTLGAEGLGVAHGTHLLIGDTVPAMAEACGRLLGDPELRLAITERAHAHFVEHFRSEVIEGHVVSLAQRVTRTTR